MKIALLVICCYLVGCINPAYIMAKIRGFDIRNSGSENAGTANAVITMGTKAGIITAVLDILKSFGCYKVAMMIFPAYPFIGALASMFCILGHVFPVFMKFKGGKGFASFGGLILAFNYKWFLLLLTCAVILLVIIDYICIVISMVCIAFPVIYGISTKDLIGTIIVAAIGLFIIFKHYPNFVRMKHGVEARFSGLFDREKEESRIRENSR